MATDLPLASGPQSSNELTRGKNHLGLWVAKHLGFFWLAQYLTRRGLRIICYHGVAIADEHLFRGKLFIDRRVLERRFSYLRNNGYNVVPLSHALEARSQGIELPRSPVVITMDDGWEG